MEYLAFQRCMDHVEKEEILLDSLITDRHNSISKHMRENMKEVKHYFYLWHLRKSKKIKVQYCLLSSVDWIINNVNYPSFKV